MAVTIQKIDPGSPAQRAGILAGDRLLSLSGHPVGDVLDYRFFMMERELSVALLREGIPYTVKVKKGEYQDLGLEFDTYLMDKQRSCKNGCVFCFVDQNPKGMRESVYFKDDDDRLSFLFGNYITLTNLTDQDVERIIQMRISPVNISVHATDPQLRVQLMRNPNAGEALKKLYRLVEGGIKINTQLVLCPGLNDGDALRNSLSELGKLYPTVQSIACVPVGLTAYRAGLYPLQPFNAQTAAAVIDCIEDFSNAFLKQNGERLAFPADELFLKAAREIPDASYYEDFAQLDNGVGMIASLREDFDLAFEPENCVAAGKTLSLATGEAAFAAISPLAARVGITAYAIPNLFFGGEITVTGLVTGSDILAALKGKALGEALLIPACMLRHEQDRFLDDMTLEALSDALGLPVRVIAADGTGLATAAIGL